MTGRVLLAAPVDALSHLRKTPYFFVSCLQYGILVTTLSGITLDLIDACAMVTDNHVDTIGHDHKIIKVGCAIKNL